MSIDSGNVTSADALPLSFNISSGMPIVTAPPEMREMLDRGTNSQATDYESDGLIQFLEKKDHHFKWWF